MFNWACAREAFEFFTKLLQVSSTRLKGQKLLAQGNALGCLGRELVAL